jgi:D-alanine-D-alanine ligase-like ATP-grasp enzyme
MQSTKKLRTPYLVSKNHSIKPLRLNKDAKKGSPERYPLDRYEYPVAIIHGSRTENAYNRVKQVLKEGGVVLNHPDNIKNASDKVRSKELFDEWEVNSTPWMLATACFKNNRFNSNLMTLKFPIVAKLRKGMGGAGMTLLEDVDALRSWRRKHGNDEVKKYFFEEVFNWGGSLEAHMKHTREYRIGVSPLLVGKHVSYEQAYQDEEGNSQIDRFDSRIGEIVALRKIMRNEAVKKGQFGRNLALGNSFFTRTFKRSYSYNKRGIQMNFSDGVELAIKAVKALGLDYGAVDILWSSTTGEWNIIEVNTAPSMGNVEEGHSFTLNQWQQAFKEMINAKRYTY